MSTLLILFFASFIGIIVMISRKLVLIENGGIPAMKETHFSVAHLDRVKGAIVRNIKHVGRMVIVSILRFFIHLSSFIGKKYRTVKSKIRNLAVKRDENGEPISGGEVSGFLRLVLEYKNKIREIKHEIKEKEENNQ